MALHHDPGMRRKTFPAAPVRTNRNREAGQTSAEFTGLLVTLTAVVVAIAGLGLNVTISETIRTAICRIAELDCAAGSATPTRSPTTACETLSNSAEIGADVVVFSVDVGGTGKYTLSRSVDAAGEDHWYVTLRGEGRLGADFMIGEKAHLGDLGEGASGEVKALLKASAATKYEFDTQRDAEDFITAAEFELGKQVVAPGWTDPFGLGHAVLDTVFGHEFDPPPPTEYIYEGGGELELSADVVAGAGSVGGKAKGAAVVGVKVTPQKDGSEPHRTVYLRLSGEQAVRLGLLQVSEGELTGKGEVTLGIEYDGGGLPVTATLDAAGTLKAQFSGKLPLGGKTKLADVFGMTPQGTPRITPSVGGAVRAKAQFRLDLTKGENRDRFADGLHSLGIPVLQGSGGDSPPNPYDGVRGIYDLFDSGADGTQLTVTRYDNDSDGIKIGVKGGDVLTFGVDGGYSSEDLRIVSGAYYAPGQGLLTWRQCGL
jgi:hypothetical protein